MTRGLYTVYNRLYEVYIILYTLRFTKTLIDSKTKDLLKRV